MNQNRYTTFQKRILAKLIDLTVVLFFGRLPIGSAGSVIGFLYSILADSFSWKGVQGQSIGKKIMKIKVTAGDETFSRVSRMKLSVIRNAPVGIVTFLMIIPVWGWILSLLIGIPLFLIELSLMIRADRHQRLGDVMAETVVVDCE